MDPFGPNIVQIVKNTSEDSDKKVHAFPCPQKLLRWGTPLTFLVTMFLGFLLFTFFMLAASRIYPHKMTCTYFELLVTSKQAISHIILTVKHFRLIDKSSK